MSTFQIYIVKSEHLSPTSFHPGIRRFCSPFIYCLNMASEANNVEGSAAARLLQKHAENPLNATVEDVPDDDLKSTLAAVGAPEKPSWGQTMSAKVAGKQPTQGPSSSLDTESHEAFPELGIPKLAAASKSNISPIWGGAKVGANGKANGASWSTNGTPLTSTPPSGVSTPTGVPPPVSIPGRNVETVLLESRYIMPRTQLKRPIPDIVKDINRKSRAVISMVPAPSGHLKFEATGPQDKAQQALRDLVQQIGVKASNYRSIIMLSSLADSCRLPFTSRSRNLLGRI